MINTTRTRRCTQDTKINTEVLFLFNFILLTLQSILSHTRVYLISREPSITLFVLILSHHLSIILFSLWLCSNAKKLPSAYQVSCLWLIFTLVCFHSDVFSPWEETSHTSLSRFYLQLKKGAYISHETFFFSALTKNLYFSNLYFLGKNFKIMMTV